MKVLFFNYEYPPLGGGAGNASFCLLHEFAKIPELEVDFVTSSFDKDFHLEKIGENIKIHKLSIGKNKKNIHLQSRKDLLVYSWKAYFYARKLVMENRYDLTHSFFTIPCGFISLLLRWQYKIPYIVSLRGSDVPGYSDRFPIIYKFVKPLVRLIWKKSYAVISNSQGLKELALKTNSKQKIGIIYNGVDVDNFKPDHNLRPTDKIIITTGASRITARKGIKYIIAAIKDTVKEHPQVLLKIMGDGNEKNDLEKLVQSLNLERHIQFLGRIPREKTHSYYQEASIFVMASLNEGMSNAMLEALSSGLPIISTDTGGAKELVHEGINGFLVRMKNNEDLAEKINRLIANNGLRESMSQESRKIAEKMSWKNVAEKYLEFYKKYSIKNEK